MRNIDTVLFDFDGTIMDTNQVIIDSWQHTFMTIDGEKRRVEDIVKTFGEPLSTTMKNFFKNVPVEESVKIYRDYHYANFSKLISLFPGMKEIVEKVRAKGYKVGLVTSRLRGTTMEGLKKYGMENHFDQVITMEDCTKHKPDPEPINIALKRLKSTAEKSIMIGDTDFDILCAKNAGVKSVLVGWTIAVSHEDENNLYKPDYIINKAEEILEII